ncbi:MAG: S8 family serine peptidase [Verrucomicrobiota bacterium]
MFTKRFFTTILFAAFIGLISHSATATPLPKNLANGLDKIIENRLIEQGKITAPPQTSSPSGQKAPAISMAAYKAAVAKEAATYAAAALTDRATGKYLVEIMPNGWVPVEALRSSLQASFPSIKIQALDTRYAGHGVLEAYVALDDVPAIAQTKGVGSVILQLRPIHSVGAVTDYGVNMHRVNRVSTLYNPAALHNYDGTGMQIGVMSDSYNSQPSEEGGYTTAQQDVGTQDLPGAGNLTNSQPVVVLQDFSSPPNATNEGRAMCQIVADIAPKARIAFATADVGELGFANNIRALGGLPGFTYPNQDFAGDVVCDDVSYLDEPMFQDGIVAQGVIDVVNAGVTYCSSAANNWGTDGYASVFRPVANGPGATANTNINLSTVPANLQGLYAGGFHNFKADGGQDIAQTINTASDAQAFIFQWNDPYDTSAPNLIEPPIFQGDGTSTAGSEVSFGPFQFTAGQLYVIAETATPGLPTDNFDGIVRITNSQGAVLVDQDTGVDETVMFFSPATDSYTITVHPYGQMPPVYTQGSFHVKINGATNVSRITQDFNCLFFDMSGNFISALGTNAFVNSRPYELSIPTFNADGFTQVQMVISRSNTTTPPNAATQLKYVYFGNGLSGVGPAEYGNYLTPVTFGHSAAAGANSIAAYAAFRPNIPENFTSPGPVVIYFDANSNRLPTPQFRQKPDIAAMDGSNNTFFPLGPIPGLTESTYDMDTNFPNFFGTSAASPHAAALAALVLQAHGGPRSLTPQQVKTIFQLTAFPHDLDPYLATGSATAGNGGAVSISIACDDSRNTGTGSNDPNVFSIAYNGPGRLDAFHFNSDATPQTAGYTTGGNFSGNASGNMTADFLDPTKYSYTPGLVWTSTFLFGNSVGLAAGDVAPSRSNAASFPSNPNPNNPNQHMWTLNLAFPNSNFTSGKVLRFNNSRSMWQDAQVPQGMTISALVRDQDYSADMLGSGILIPEYIDTPTVMPGMTFNGTIVDGATTYPFSGRLTNKIGKGYSVLDGYGFINAEAATTGALPVPGVVSRKTHGVAGTFDIPLPFNGAAGVECRTPGPNNSHTLVFTFDRPVAATGNASITQGTASSPTVAPGPNPNQVTVTVSNVSNAQHLVVTLSNAQDGNGATFSPVSARMDVLLGDSTGNGAVNSSDVSQAKSQSGNSVTASNFRVDVTADGAINASDISLIKSKSGTGLAADGATSSSKK